MKGMAGFLLINLLSCLSLFQVETNNSLSVEVKGKFDAKFWILILELIFPLIIKQLDNHRR